MKTIMLSILLLILLFSCKENVKVDKMPLAIQTSASSDTTGADAVGMDDGTIQIDTQQETENKIDEPKKEIPLDEYSLDTVNFDDIKIYNKIKQKEFGLFTSKKNIDNFRRSDTVYTGSMKYTEGAGKDYGFMFNPEDLPFFTIPIRDGFYVAFCFETYIEHLGFLILVDDDDDVMNWGDNVLIHSIESCDNIIISIKSGDETIYSNTETTSDLILSCFPNSYQTYFDHIRKNNNNELIILYINVLYNNKSEYMKITFKRSNDKNYYLESLWLEKKEHLIYGDRWFADPYFNQ